MTAAFVVTWKGRVIAERYGPGISVHTPLESWSMGKSLTATLMGILIREGFYSLLQPAPVPEWQGANDPRVRIRIADILHMSSGLRSGPAGIRISTYPGHIATICISTLVASTRSRRGYSALQWPPGAVGRYHNTDPVLINYLVRLAVESARRVFVRFAACALRQNWDSNDGDETDPFGNFLTQ